MIKQIVFLKRRKDLDLATFKDYYEAHHRKIGERVLAGFAVSYIRRYLDPAHSSTPNPPFDVITEMWFPDWAAQKACMAHLSDPVIAAEIQADEAELFDPDAKWGGFLSEEVSVMPPVQQD